MPPMTWGESSSRLAPRDRLMFSLGIARTLVVSLQDDGPFAIVRSLGSYPSNPLTGSQIRTEQSSGALNSTVGEQGAPLTSSSTRFGWSWDVGTTSGARASVGWGIDHDWDSGVACWVNWARRKAITCIKLVSVYTGETQKHLNWDG